MSYVISKDMGKGNPPAFYAGDCTWSVLQNAKEYATETLAQDAIDNNDFLTGCIVMPNDETVFEGTSIKSVAVLSGMKPDTHQDD
jgi:hypothetical protein